MKESEAWLRVAEDVDDIGCGIGDTLRWLELTYVFNFAILDFVLIDQMRLRLHDTFAPKGLRGRGYWWRLPTSGEGNTPRVLAALFLREMALDEEKARAKQR